MVIGQFVNAFRSNLYFSYLSYSLLSGLWNVWHLERVLWSFSLPLSISRSTLPSFLWAKWTQFPIKKKEGLKTHLCWLVVTQRMNQPLVANVIINGDKEGLGQLKVPRLEERSLSWKWTQISSSRLKDNKNSRNTHLDLVWNYPCWRNDLISKLLKVWYRNLILKMETVFSVPVQYILRTSIWTTKNWANRHLDGWKFNFTSGLSKIWLS